MRNAKAFTPKGLEALDNSKQASNFNVLISTTIFSCALASIYLIIKQVKCRYLGFTSHMPSFTKFTLLLSNVKPVKAAETQQGSL